MTFIHRKMMTLSSSSSTMALKLSLIITIVTIICNIMFAVVCVQSSSSSTSTFINNILNIPPSSPGYLYTQLSGPTTASQSATGTSQYNNPNFKKLIRGKFFWEQYFVGVAESSSSSQQGAEEGKIVYSLFTTGLYPQYQSVGASIASKLVLKLDTTLLFNTSDGGQSLVPTNFDCPNFESYQFTCSVVLVDTKDNTAFLWYFSVFIVHPSPSSPYIQEMTASVMSNSIFPFYTSNIQNTSTTRTLPVQARIKNLTKTIFAMWRGNYEEVTVFDEEATEMYNINVSSLFNQSNKGDNKSILPRGQLATMRNHDGRKSLLFIPLGVRTFCVWNFDTRDFVMNEENNGKNDEQRVFELDSENSFSLLDGSPNVPISFSTMENFKDRGTNSSSTTGYFPSSFEKKTSEILFASVCREPSKGYSTGSCIVYRLNFDAFFSSSKSSSTSSTSSSLYLWGNGGSYGCGKKNMNCYAPYQGTISNIKQFSSSHIVIESLLSGTENDLVYCIVDLKSGYSSSCVDTNNVDDIYNSHYLRQKNDKLSISSSTSTRTSLATCTDPTLESCNNLILLNNKRTLLTSHENLPVLNNNSNTEQARAPPGYTSSNLCQANFDQTLGSCSGGDVFIVPSYNRRGGQSTTKIASSPVLVCTNPQTVPLLAVWRLIMPTNPPSQTCQESYYGKGEFFVVPFWETSSLDSPFAPSSSSSSSSRSHERRQKNNNNVGDPTSISSSRIFFPLIIATSVTLADWSLKSIQHQEYAILFVDEWGNFLKLGTSTVSNYVDYAPRVPLTLSSIVFFAIAIAIISFILALKKFRTMLNV